MNRYTVRPNRFTPLMQDVSLARSETVAAMELRTRGRLAADAGRYLLASDREIVVSVLATAWREVTSAWHRAARRGPAVRQLKRIDRRLLRDLGIERAQIRDVVDELAARQASRAAAMAGATRPPAPTVLTSRTACP